MNVLMISGDRNLLREGSEAQKRLALQRSAVERLDVFVWPQVHSRREILEAAKHGGYDVVTAQDPFWRGLLALRAARLARAKCNVQVHADLSAYGPLRRVLAQIVLRRADSVRVVSEKIKAQAQALGARGPVQVLPVFVDLEPFRNLAHRSAPGKTVLWFGRFEPEKDPALAISVMKTVREKGVEAKLVLLGAGSLEGELRRMAQDLPWVEFASWGDPKPYLARADLVLSTSKHESWGASIVEALAAGVPVVAPDVGIARDAGAIVASRAELGAKAAEALQSGARGVLLLRLPSAEEWTRAWLKSF